MEKADKIPVAIIGASSQVGASTALYLKKYTHIEPICFIRSEYSKVFFDLFEIQTETIDLSNGESTKAKLTDFKWVIDFTYPTGQVAEIPKIIKKNLQNIINSIPEGSNFIYMSSIMAYGMPEGDKQLKTHHFSHTTYSYIKRKAEHYTKSFCRRNHVNPYIFRLSQVHGFLQSVNSSYRKKLSHPDTLFLNVSESELSNTIFIPSIGKAIEKCIHNEVKPGLYTLVSEPQWTFKELYDYYFKSFNINRHINYNASGNDQKNKSFKQQIIKLLKKFRPLIESYILIKIPSISIKIKGRYRIQETKSLVTAQKNNYFDFHLSGIPSTNTIKDLDSEPHKIFEIEKDMETHYNNTIQLKDTVK